jgi:hypothetical protein
VLRVKLHASACYARIGEDRARHKVQRWRHLSDARASSALPLICLGLISAYRKLSNTCAYSRAAYYSYMKDLRDM